MAAPTTQQHLDADELLHLALAASEQDKTEEAISLLKRALAVSPQDARLHYLLGAQHAQIGLYDRATEEMQQAVNLDPNLETAHFQLGMLHITSGRLQPATEAWKPLDKLGPDHPLYLFKTGMLHLAKDEFAECKKYLTRGITANHSNPALNKDMERVLKEIERVNTPVSQTPATNSTTARPKATAPKHVVLSAYKQNKTDDKDA